MDPVSLAASVGSLVQITCAITKLSYGYFSGVKNAGEAQKSYRIEMAALMEVLFQLERTLDSPDTAHLVVSRAAELDRLIKQCRDDLSRVHSKLSQASHHLSKFIWPLKSKELKEQVERIHRLRSIIGDFVSSIILAATSQTHAPIKSLTLSQERTQLLSKLPPHRDVSKPRPMPCPGTGTWFIESHPFQDWLSKDCGLLWCYGPPGVGKSLLASVAVSHLVDHQQQQREPYLLCHFFCDYALQDRQSTVAVLQSLVYQAIEQGGAEILDVARAHLALLDSSDNPDNLAAFLKATCRSGTKLAIIFDAEDEMNRQESVVDFLVDLSGLGCHVLITSRLVRSFAENLAATIMPIDASGTDIESYVKHRFRHNEIAATAMDMHLLPRIVEKSNGLFLLSKLLVDQLLEFPTVTMMLRFLESAPGDLDQAFEATMARINAQAPALRRLAHRTLGWTVHAKRPLSAQELVHAFAVEDGLQDEIHAHSLTTSKLIVRCCAGFITIDGAGAVRFAHASVYAFCSGLVKGASELKHDLSRTCIRYLRLKPMASGPCGSVQELLARGSEMPFLMYAAKNVGSHIPDDLAVDDETAVLMMDLVSNAACRESMWQALFYDADIKTPEIAEDYFNSLPSHPTALHLAAYWNLAGICERLLSRGDPPSAPDSQQWTPLHWAAANGCESVVALLLNCGAAVDARDSEGWTPLFWASFEGHTSVVQALLLSGADHLVLGGPSNWTALHWAISRSNLEVIKLLISHDRRTRECQEAASSRGLVDASSQTKPSPAEGFDHMLSPFTHPQPEAERPSVDPNQLSLDFFEEVAQKLNTPSISGKDRTQYLVFFQPSSGKSSCSGSRLRAFRPLVSNLAWRTTQKAGKRAMAGRKDVVASRPSQWKEILLHSAIVALNFPAAQLLIELGADASLRDPEVPFLQTAASLEDHRFLELLLSATTDASSVVNTPFKGISLLHHAVYYNSEATEKTISCLIRHGADANVADSRGRTPLIYAFIYISKRSQREALVTQLLSSGASPRHESISGETAFDFVLVTEDLGCAELLLRSGARPELPETEDFWRRVNSETARSLLDLFASFSPDCSLEDMINRVSKTTGQTALTLAMTGRNWAVVRLLVSLGGYVPRSAQIRAAVYAALSEFSWQAEHEDGVFTVVDVATRDGARLAPNDGAVLYFLAHCRLLMQRDEERWRCGYQDQCCRVISKLVSVGCRLDLRLPRRLLDHEAWTAISITVSGGLVEYNPVDPEAGMDALFLAENWLASDLVAKTIVGLTASPPAERGDSGET